MFEITESPGGRRHLTLPANLDHTVVHDLKAALLECVASGQDIDVNASEVGRLSTPAMQVLVSACSPAKNAVAAIKLVSPSNAFRDFTAMLALEDEFGRTEISA